MNRPNHKGLIPSASMRGKNIGIVINIMDTGSMNIPIISNEQKMNKSIIPGVTSNDVANSSSPELAPENASNWLKILEFKMMKKTMPETLIVESRAAFRESNVRMLNSLAKKATPRTPNAADSVGVAIPKMINPITIRTTSAMGMMFVMIIKMLARQPSLGVS